MAAFVAGVLSITSPCVLPSFHSTWVTSQVFRYPARPLIVKWSFATHSPLWRGFPDFHRYGDRARRRGIAGIYRRSRRAKPLLAGQNRRSHCFSCWACNSSDLIHLPFLGRERRIQHFTESTGSVTSSFVIGATFGAGWSPCVGPILGAILTMAAGQGDTVRAAWLLVAYSAGLAVPFLLFAALGTTSRILKSMSRHLVRREFSLRWHHGRRRGDHVVGHLSTALHPNRCGRSLDPVGANDLNQLTGTTFPTRIS